MLSALQLISLPLNGLGNGMQPFVSYNYGKGNAQRLKMGITYVTVIAFIFVLILAVIRKVIILIPLCFVLTHFLGFKGVYMSERIADLVAGIITTVVIFTTFPRIFKKRQEKVQQQI